LVGAVLVAGARAPVLVSRALVQQMRPRSVIVDASIDQGGCVETSRPTTHTNPVYVEEEVIHYCVPNMPGKVAHTATYALSNVVLPYVARIAEQGLDAALASDAVLAKGVVMHEGHLVNPLVAAALGLGYQELAALL
jgi:alanine dehydrogenase